MTERQLFNWAVKFALYGRRYGRMRRWPLKAICRLMEARYLLTGRI